MSEIDKIIAWSKESPGRLVSIKSNNEKTEIFVYFNDIMCGQIVTKLSDINKEKAYENHIATQKAVERLIKEEY